MSSDDTLLIRYAAPLPNMGLSIQHGRTVQRRYGSFESFCLRWLLAYHDVYCIWTLFSQRHLSDLAG